MSITDNMKSIAALQLAVFSVPLVGRFFEHRSALPFPPVGDSAPSRTFFAMLFIATSVLIPYFMPSGTRRRGTVVALFVLSISFALLYSHLEDLYVVPLSDGTTFVIKGSVRKPRLPEQYASMEDQDLIEHSGARDADLEHAYTRDSLEKNRNKIFFSYVLSLISLQLVRLRGAHG